MLRELRVLFVDTEIGQVHVFIIKSFGVQRILLSCEPNQPILVNVYFQGTVTSHNYVDT